MAASLRTQQEKLKAFYTMTTTTLFSLKVETESAEETLKRRKESLRREILRKWKEYEDLEKSTEASIFIFETQRQSGTHYRKIAATLRKQIKASHRELVETIKMKTKLLLRREEHKIWREANWYIPRHIRDLTRSQNDALAKIYSKNLKDRVAIRKIERNREYGGFYQDYLNMMNAVAQLTYKRDFLKKRNDVLNGGITNILNYCNTNGQTEKVQRKCLRKRITFISRLTFEGDSSNNNIITPFSHEKFRKGFLQLFGNSNQN